jgi:sulfate/thiosulfate transport system ATP-binding protein
VITVQNVTKFYGDFRALDDVSLTIPDGSLTALLGPSGSGKTSLLRVIAGLEEPDAGAVVISGQDVTRISPQGRNIGFVFQHYAAFKHMTVRDNVAFGLTIRKKPKGQVDARVNELLGIVGLAGYHDRYPNQLSGGQRQRMALARALAVDPTVLLLDEPFGALDAKVREELRAWLRRLHDEVHVTTVLVTHDQEEAMDVAGHIVVMNGGRIEQVGTPREVYENPQTEFVLRFLGPVATLRGELVRPHDLVLTRHPAPGAVEGKVSRVTHLGFEVRVEIRTLDDETVTAQLTRGEAWHLGIDAGDSVHITAESPDRMPRRPHGAPDPIAVL